METSLLSSLHVGYKCGLWSNLCAWISITGCWPLSLRFIASLFWTPHINHYFRTVNIVWGLSCWWWWVLTSWCRIWHHVFW